MKRLKKETPQHTKKCAVQSLIISNITGCRCPAPRMSIILYAAPVPRTDYSPLTGSLIISAVAPGRNDKDCILTESLPGQYHAVHSPFALFIYCISVRSSTACAEGAILCEAAAFAVDQFSTSLSQILLKILEECMGVNITVCSYRSCV